MSIHAPYTAAHCKRMIAHYEAQAQNWTKPESFLSLARVSVVEWKLRLVRAEAEEGKRSFRMKTPIFELGREDFKRGEARPSHYPARAEGWDFEHRHASK